MEEDFKKFMTAKRILGYNMCMTKSKKEDGTIDEEKLNSLLKQNHEYIRSQLLTRKLSNPNFDKDLVEREIKEIDYLYSLVKDEKARSKNDSLAKEEKHCRQLPKISEEEVKGIIKDLMSKPLEENKYTFSVSPEGESTKKVLVIPKRKYQYITKLGVTAYLREYEVVKNIYGVDSHFTVTTNTDFDEVNKIYHSDKPISKAESEYLKLFYMQMSDIHLNTCRRRFNGYIGTVDNNMFSAKFDMDSEDYAATKEIRKQELEEER